MGCLSWADPKWKQWSCWSFGVAIMTPFRNSFHFHTEQLFLCVWTHFLKIFEPFLEHQQLAFCGLSENSPVATCTWIFGPQLAELFGGCAPLEAGLEICKARTNPGLLPLPCCCVSPVPTGCLLLCSLSDGRGLLPSEAKSQIKYFK